MLVNTTGKHLNLQDNACAKSFSKVAGPKLQEYCNAIAPVKVGDIGVTLPGNLKSKYVFHAVCGDWQSGSGEKVSMQHFLNESECCMRGFKTPRNNNSTRHTASCFRFCFSVFGRLFLNAQFVEPSQQNYQREMLMIVIRKQKQSVLYERRSRAVHLYDLRQIRSLM